MNYLDSKVLTSRCFMFTFLIFLSLFFIDIVFGDNKIGKQFVRPFIYTNGLKDMHEVSSFKRTELVVGVIENRFVARGVIIDIRHTAEGPQRFVMHIKEIESIEDYSDFGEEYLDKTVEVLSEIGIPPVFRPGIEVSLVLRVSGDEWGQYLFLVELIDNEKT